MLCMGCHADPTYNGFHDFCERLLTSVFSYKGSICFWNDSFFHWVTLYWVLPKASPAVQCKHWRSAALMASDAPLDLQVKHAVITLPWQDTTWDFKGSSTEDNIFQVLKDTWEDMQNNPSTVLKFISHCIASVFQRMVSFLLFQVEINQWCNSEPGLKLIEVKTVLLSYNLSRLFAPTQMPFSPSSGSVCVSVSIHFHRPLNQSIFGHKYGPALEKEDYLSLYSDSIFFNFCFNPTISFT